MNSIELNAHAQAVSTYIRITGDQAITAFFAGAITMALIYSLTR